MGWHGFEAPWYLCVSTPGALAYIATRWMPPSLFGRGATPLTRQMINTILLSESAVLALLCFLHVARDSLPFSTKYPDPRLAHWNGNEPSERGSLFRLSPGLLQLIRSVGVAAIVEGTAVDPAGAEVLLDFSERLDWSLPERGNFVWYGWSRGCSLRMLHSDGASAEADDWYEPLLQADIPSYWAVVQSGDGWGVAVSSSRPPVEPSTESLLVTAVSPSPLPGEAAGVDPGVGTTESPPVRPSTPAVVDKPSSTGSPP